MLRKFLSSCLLLCTLVAFATSVHAYSSPGSPDGFVTDITATLASEADAAIERIISEHNASTSNEIAVAIISTVGADETIESYATALFEEWGVGTAKNDNGVLLLIALDDRELRIEVGYGLEGALTDTTAQNIIDNEIIPYLQSDDVAGAVENGVRAIALAIAGEYVATPSQSQSVDDSWFEAVIYALFFIPQWFMAITARSKSFWAGGVFGAVAGAGLSFLFTSNGSLSLAGAGILTTILTLVGAFLDWLISRAYTKHMKTNTTIPWWAGGSTGSSSSSGSSSSTGSSSFGGFSGGSSGGGGASGRW
jgi:uncharacterized protein